MGLIIVTSMVVVFLLFIKFGDSVFSTEKLFGLVKSPKETNQKLTLKKTSNLATSQNENVQNITLANNSNPIQQSNSEPFIDPEISPRVIRKVESQLADHKDEPIDTPKIEQKNQQVSIEDKYPLLFASIATTIENPSHTAYLTFDDGPSPVTLDILEVLKSRGVKATFFVVGNQVEMYPNILKQIVDEGHAIGIHTDTHNYEKVYSSLDTFLSDYEKCYEKIKVVTDYPVTITRYPGGSINKYNKNIKDQTREELKRRGFSYFDWNVSSGDSAPNGVTSEQFVNNILNGVRGKNVAVILTHDAMGRTVTAESIGKVIDELAKMGYQFGVLGNNIKPIQF